MDGRLLLGKTAFDAEYPSEYANNEKRRKYLRRGNTAPK